MIIPKSVPAGGDAGGGTGGEGGAEIQNICEGSLRVAGRVASLSVVSVAGTPEGGTLSSRQLEGSRSGWSFAVTNLYDTTVDAAAKGEIRMPRLEALR
jgi:hypothetical protein